MAGINKLTGADLRRALPGRYLDGGGLYLQVTTGADGTARRSWLFRWTARGRERWAGLGSLNTVTLAEARERARQCRLQVLDGVDPIEARDRRRAEQAAAAKRVITFDEAARGYIAAKRTEWRNAKHAATWPASIAKYASPVIGKLPVDAIDTPLILKVLQPIWGRIPESASRLRGRIESVLDWATVSKHRAGDNPARWQGHLKLLLAAPSKRTRGSLAAMPYGEVPAFMAVLRVEPGVTARALEFAILTAARSNEVRGATWGEIDLQNAKWTVPAERIKAKKEHRVPLSPRALEILRAQPRDSDLVFPGRAGVMMSDKTLLSFLHKLGGDVTVHGFRSAFRTWAAERTNFAREIAEQALAHAVGTAVERAYKRTDMFDQRRRLMEMWAEYCGRPAITGTTVVSLGGRGSN